MDADRLITFLTDVAPRRLRVIENILIGKRSVSTLYWGLRYNKLAWLGYDKHLSRNEMEAAVKSLSDSGFVTVSDTNAQLTAAGAKYQQQILQIQYQPQALAVRLNVDVETFWQRFLLATQVVSEYSYHTKHYYPLQVPWAVKQAIKGWFKRYHEQDLSLIFHTVITQFLQQLPGNHATFFSQLLVGHLRPGETLTQLSHQFGPKTSDAQLLEIDLICQLVVFLEHQPQNSVKALLTGLIGTPLSDSNLLTLNSFNAGNTLETISHERQLKLSTVREHLLEAAIMLPLDAFAYQRILTEDLIDQLTSHFAGQPIDDWQFQQVADLKIEFWQFRLFEILRSKQTDDQI